VWIRFPRQLGDVLFSVPFFGALQREWNAAAAEEGSSLRWIAVGHSIGAALFSEAHPDFIAESHIESGGQGKPDPWHLLRRWRERKPAAVINLSQSARLVFGAWMAGVPLRAGVADNHLGLLYHFPFKYRDLPVHLAVRFEPLLRLLTGRADQVWVPLGPDNLGGRKGPETLRAAGWSGQPYVTFATGTRGFGKRWFPQEEKWPALGRLLHSQGFAVVFLGGPDEMEFGTQLSALVPGAFDLTGKTSLPDALAIQHGAYGNVAIDTGLAHTAAASGRPTVCLMGNSPDHLISPVGPFVANLRGSAVDNHRGESEGFQTWGSSAHRIPPERVADALHALAGEIEGTRVAPR
jgi:ADP-heptose:LPS heptosyltransferase